MRLSRPTSALAVIGFAAIALYHVVGDVVVQSLVYEGLGAVAVVAVALRARRAGDARRGLALVAGGLACWVGGDVLTDVLRLLSRTVIPYPSVADVGYVLGYLLVLAGTAVLARDLVGRRPWLALIDAAIATVTFLVIGCGVDAAAGATGTSLGALVYPAMDVFVLAAGLRLLGGISRVDRSLGLVALGVVAMFCADIAYAADAMHYTVGGTADNGWLIAYLCFALAASVRADTRRPIAAEELRLRPHRLALLALALLVTPIAAMIGSRAHETLSGAFLMALPSATLALLVLTRMAIVLVAHDRARVAERCAHANAVRAQRVAEVARREAATEHERLLESEIRFRHIFDYAGVAIVLVGADREVLAINRGASRMFGYPTQEFVERGVAGLTHPDDLGADDDVFADLVAGRRDAYTTEKRYLRRDGRLCWGRLTYSAARREDGTFKFAIGIVDDVTAVREAEAALQESERRLDHMFADARIGMAVTDSRGRWVRANAALCEMLGYSEEELRGTRFADVTHPDDLDENLQSLQQLRAGEIKSFEVEKRYIRRDGGVIRALLSVSMIRDGASGEPLFGSQIQDVTARHEALTELRASERRLRAIVENTVEGIVVVDGERRIDTVNPAACAIAGRDAGQLVGTTLDDLAGVPSAAIEAWWASLRDDDGTATADAVISRPDGSHVDLEIAAVADVLQDRHLLIVRDVSDRHRAERALRRSEERWRAVVESLEDVLVVMGDDRRVAWVNGAAERLLQYRPDQWTGTDFLSFLHPEDRAGVSRALESAVGTASDLVVARIRQSDGEYRAFETRAVDVPTAAGERNVVLSARDVSERLALDAERQGLEEERRIAQRLEAVGQLAAGIAHEINTPIQFVGDSVRFLQEAFEDLWMLIARYRALLFGESELSREERQAAMLAAEDDADLAYLEERIGPAFERVFEGVKRVSTIVQAMRRFGHSTESELALADVNDAISATLTVSRNEYKYVADVETDLGNVPAIMGNAGELGQVLLNLIVNAAHAIGAAGGARGTISIATAVDDDGDTVVIEVADTGCGIPDAARERIFEPFFTTKEVGKGTGQGLAISRSIVERHGGTLSFRSEVGRGTTFTVRLPTGGAPPNALAA